MKGSTLLIIATIFAVPIVLAYKSRNGTGDSGGSGESGGTSNGTAKLTASWANGYLTFRFSGFTPGSQVYIDVKETGGYLIAEADANGGGYYSFETSEPAGTYTLEAIDSNDLYASATFKVT
ncbi:MAG: hypothetical protein JW967_01570 [Dehalococcoidales bacterium]|nr:hypothetical protein [Dehalococcoidales bacterium]